MKLSALAFLGALVLSAAAGAGAVYWRDRVLVRTMQASLDREAGHYRAERAALLAAHEATLAQVAEIAAREARAVLRRDSLAVRADSARLASAALRAATDSARTLADSVRALVAERDGLDVEVGLYRQRAEAGEIALTEAQARARALDVAGGAAERRALLAEGRLREVEMLRAREVLLARGTCRVPVLGVRCPVLGPGYGLALVDGRVRHGPTLSVSVPF